MRKLARLEIASRGRSCAVIAVRTRSLHVRGKDSPPGKMSSQSRGLDPDGGPGAKLSEEAHPGDYPEIVELLAAGISVPARVDSGSAAVRDVLRRHGAVDPE